MPWASADQLIFDINETGGILQLVMRTYTAVVERCPETDLYVGYIPGFPGAHSQAATMEELTQNLKEVVEMLLEDGEPELEAVFVGTQAIQVAHV
jgi:predicted RNase H-like HicB family nuclease